MRLTKFEHACVRLTEGPTTIVLDPGTWTDPASVEGADAILVTHEHLDHFDRVTIASAARASTEVAVWAPGGVARQLNEVDELAGRVHTVAHGDVFTVGELDVHVYGEWHARTHMDPVANVGYRIGGRVFHPGDAFLVPQDPVEVLLLPSTAPWLKALEAIDYADAVAASQGFAIHDGFIADFAQGLVDGIMAATSKRTGSPYRRLGVGESTEL